MVRLMTQYSYLHLTATFGYFWEFFSIVVLKIRQMRRLPDNLPCAFATLAFFHALLDFFQSAVKKV